jgi:hypothetical protein
MLANPPWRPLRERAEKIPRDKKHDAGRRGFSQRTIRSRCPIRHRNALAERVAANIDSVLNGAVLRLGFITSCPNEKEGTHAHTVILRPLSYMWCPCREALCAAFRCSALRGTCRPEVLRYGGRRGDGRELA